MLRNTAATGNCIVDYFILESIALYRRIYISACVQEYVRTAWLHPVLRQVRCGQKESMNSLRSLHFGPLSSKFILFEDLMLVTPPLGYLRKSQESDAKICVGYESYKTRLANSFRAAGWLTCPWRAHP